MGPLFMNMGTLEGGLKSYGFSRLPVGGAKLRQRASGMVTPTFLAPTVSIKMATKHAGMKGYEKTRMQITKIRKIKAVTCSHYNRGSRRKIEQILRSLVAPLRGAGGFL